MENVSTISNTWLYQGPISKIAVAVDPAPKASGGYVIALQLSNGATRLAASRAPAQYVGVIANSIRSSDDDMSVKRVFISHYMARYETVKRWIGQELKAQKIGPETYDAPISVVTRKLSEALTVAVRKLG